MSKLDTVVTTKVPGDLVRRLDRIARERGDASRASVVRAALNRGLEDLERAHERWAAEVRAQRGEK